MAKSPMNTGGVSDTVFHIFEGTVTCMLNRGKRVRVGALGRVSLEAEFGPEPRRQELPGTYAQVLTVEFGEFANPFEAHGRPLTESFGTLGELHEVLPSEGPPICSQGSFAHQNTAAPFDGVIYISPSITTPRDGHISKTGAVTLAGTGEPNHVVKVYEVGHEASATETTASATGSWSLALSGLSVGKHSFTASAVDGSTIPTNTVEIVVK